MKAVYFGPDWKPVEADFDLYRDRETKSPVTMLHDPAYPASDRHIRHDEYDAIIAAFGKLDPRMQAIMKAQALHAHSFVQDTPSPLSNLSRSESEKFVEAISAAGLDLSARSLTVVNDHVTGRAGRNEAVYSVGGRPLPERSMTPVQVSFCMGRNFFTVKRIMAAFSDYGHDNNRLALALQREVGLENFEASKILDAPATPRIRSYTATQGRPAPTYV